MRVFNRIGMTLLAVVVTAFLCAGCGETSSTSQTTDSSSPQANQSEYDEQEIGQEAFEEMKAKSWL